MTVFITLVLSVLTPISSLQLDARMKAPTAGVEPGVSTPSAEVLALKDALVNYRDGLPATEKLAFAKGLANLSYNYQAHGFKPETVVASEDEFLDKHPKLILRSSGDKSLDHANLREAAKLIYNLQNRDRDGLVSSDSDSWLESPRPWLVWICLGLGTAVAGGAIAYGLYSTFSTGVYITAGAGAAFAGFGVYRHFAST